MRSEYFRRSTNQEFKVILPSVKEKVKKNALGERKIEKKCPLFQQISIQ